MKSIMKNSLLVLILAFLMILPVVAFGFINKSPKVDDALVLGAEYRNIKNTEKQVPNKIEIVDQLDLDLKLSKERSQKFYDFIPQDYLNTDYQVLVVIPQEYRELGIYAELQNNELSLTLPQNLEVEDLRVTLLFVK